MVPAERYRHQHHGFAEFAFRLFRLASPAQGESVLNKGGKCVTVVGATYLCQPGGRDPQVSRGLLRPPKLVQRQA